MMITNAKDAAEWLVAWGWKPRKGIAKEAVRGLRVCAAVCRGARNFEMAQSYTDAADLITRHMQRPE